MDDDELAKRASPTVSPRIARARLAVSREAARLFWLKGVAATTGDEIAAAVGVSTRSIWRYFRSKESCVEPILAATAVRFVETLRGWQTGESLASLLIGDFHAIVDDPRRAADELAGARMIYLADQDPVVRTSWLMVVDQTEAALRPIVADWLDLPEDHVTVWLVAGATATATRVVNEHYTVNIIRNNSNPPGEETMTVLAAAIHNAVKGFAPDFPAAAKAGN